MNIFDILGPIMVGPSSSHTAGAVRMGLITRKLLGEEPIRARIILHGSFADTGVGHGTDKALIAGLLGMQPDDIRIPHSDMIAKEQNLSVTFEREYLDGIHPNTAILEVEGNNHTKIKTQVCSLGGGRIMVHSIDDVEVNISGEHYTLVIHNEDRPGYVARITHVLSERQVNIATMQLCREKRGGDAVMILEMDQEISEEIISCFRQLDGIKSVTYVSKIEV